MTREITVYTADWCGSCKEWVPKILGICKERGFNIVLIDVDSSNPDDKRRCANIQWVPTIEYQGSEISYQDLEEMHAL